MADFQAVPEFLIDGVWTEVDVLQRDAIVITRGRSDEASQPEPSHCAFTLKDPLGKYAPRNPLGQFYGKIGRNTPVRVRYPTSETNYLALPGDLASYISTPDVAALDVTGDLDVRVEWDLLTWRPVNQFGLARKWVDDNDVFNNQASWVLDLRTDGTLRFYWATSGFFSSSLDAQSTVAIPDDSTRLTVRVTIDVDNGAAGRDIKFWTSTTGVEGSFTQLGATVTQAGVTSIFSSNSPVEVGRTVDGSAVQGDIPSAVQGKLYRFQMRSGIGGTVVADPDFTAQDSGASTFTDSAGRVWTLNGSAAVINTDCRFHGELSSLPPRWDKRGRDVNVPIEAYGVLRRLRQGASALKSVLYRLFTSSSGVVAYWPCEDPEGADEFASGLPGGIPMRHPSGDTTNATYDQFRASDPLPEASSVEWSGQVPVYSFSGEAQVGFLMRTGGVGATSQVCQIHSFGTAYKWTLHVNTAGDLRLQAFDSEDAALMDSGFVAHAVNGKKARITITLEQDGSDVDWSLATYAVGQSPVITSGTLAGKTIGRVAWVHMNPGATLTSTVFGHITVRSAAPTVNDVTNDQLEAYVGEIATARIVRLCQEEGVPVMIEGDVTDAVTMGPQLPNKLVDLLRECADSDIGILYEPRGFLGLAYRTRASLYSQDPGLTLDYSAGHLSAIEPVEDDDATRNDITVNQILGSSARAELTEGALSVLPPPNGVGRYDDSVEISLSSGRTLPQQAAWRVHLGTVDEERYPVLGVGLHRHPFTSDPGFTASVLALDVGDKAVVTKLPAWMPPDDVQQIVQGYTETIIPSEWNMDINCSPGSPWDVGIWDSSTGPGEARYSPDLTTLAEDLTTTETAVDITTATGPEWGTADLPYDIVVGGERMTVTAVTGVGAAQTMTVTRSVNDIEKTHLTGAEVRLFHPARYAL